ncbi:MAG: acyl-CoA/acyl-ACP dehydrogenase [Acidimicrobiia bacterium]|nr:acyl-CoA/acyl-ACP dehydrogenase [Acidimicrobiia bacterium]
MDFTMTDEQSMLRDTVRSLLEDKATSPRVREVMESPTGVDDELWGSMAEMGLQAMHLPEEFGGAGFTLLETGIVLEELGRAVAPVPYFSSVVLGATAVLIAGSPEQKAEVLPKAGSGQLRLALAITEEGRGWGTGDIATEATPDDDSFVLNGAKAYVVDGHSADMLVVSAREGSGVSLFLVPTDIPHVTRHRMETMDMTRQQAVISFDGARVPSAARLGEAGSGVATLDMLYDIAAAMLAFEQVGGAQRCLEMAVEYAKDRKQFGRAIGSFQAIKHKCADMLVQVESARSAAYFAGWAASHSHDELMVAAPTAKAYCSDAYFSCAAENIQVHGGIGFTWEHDAHLYFKRAKTSQLLFGDPGEWRELLASRLGV